MSIHLIVGLGNPGLKYEGTRHNVGKHFVQMLAQEWSLSWKEESKFEGFYTISDRMDHKVVLYHSNQYMNQNGSGLAKIARFFKVPVTQMLVVHDELDFPVAKIRFKSGGGHGGHNGLRDCIKHLGGSGFTRLRLGIDHPGQAHLVSRYVLKTLPKEEAISIESAWQPYLHSMKQVVTETLEHSMNRLHSQ